MTFAEFEHVELLKVEAWGRHVGTLGAARRGHMFEYRSSWVAGTVELAPLTTPSDQQGNWRLSPAYDLTFTPKTGLAHQTFVLGKARGITQDDLTELARIHGISDPQTIIEQVKSAVSMWGEFAAMDRVPAADKTRVAAAIPRWAAAAAAQLSRSARRGVLDDRSPDRP